jgi:hypothetical protein
MRKILILCGLLLSLSTVSVLAAPVLYSCHGKVTLSEATFTGECALRTLMGRAAFTGTSSTYSYSVQLYDNTGKKVAFGSVNALNKNRDIYYNINVLYGTYKHSHMYDKYLN